MKSKTIIVVGGGPAGMMAAIRAAQSGGQVTLLERNERLGKKLLLTGKGRCNLTNAADLESFMQAFGKSGQFLRDAFKVFFNRELMEFFEKRGLMVRVERQERVFPETNRASSVLKVLQEELEKLKVTVFFRSRVKQITRREKVVTGVVLEDGRVLPAEAVIVATGGVSYEFTGSSGDGLTIASELGHMVVATRPGLVALETVEKFPGELSGLALKNIRLTFSDGKHRLVSEIGELLFTGFGISGPLVLSLSRQVVDWLAPGQSVMVSIDLKPALSIEQLEKRFCRDFVVLSKKTIRNGLKEFLPGSLIEVFLTQVKVPLDKPVNQITQEERRRLAAGMKAFTLHIRQALPVEEAMVTKGGVALKDIDPRTMASRKVKGLYFAGELIDVDGDTGGYNLQAAFSTGYLAGESAANVH